MATTCKECLTEHESYTTCPPKFWPGFVPGYRVKMLPDLQGERTYPAAKDRELRRAGGGKHLPPCWKLPEESRNG